jgi:hypothetical protein
MAKRKFDYQTLNELLKADDTLTVADLNKLAGVGATLASGTAAAHITDASVAHALNSTFSDTEVEAALNALGGKINAILLVLEAFQQTATS